MDNESLQIVNILFFGAGKIGKSLLEQCRDFNIVPERVIDNDKNLWGTLCEGIEVISPDRIKSFEVGYIFITCNREDEIHQQLLELGVAEDRIVSGVHNIWNRLLYYVMKEKISMDNTEKSFHKPVKKRVLFDLQNGMVLGGVETWVYGLAKSLQEIGYKGIYLTMDTAGPSVVDMTCPAQILQYDGTEKKDRIRFWVEKIMEHLPCTIICNFPQEIFWSACIAKQMHPDQIRIIAVQHSDDQTYYEAYHLWQEYVDKYLIISSRIEHKLLSLGINKNKCASLVWKVSCEECLKKEWSKEGTCLQIGYAGRVTTTSKRVDLLLILAAKLKEKNVSFQINIAGAGNYSRILQENIQEKNLQQCIILVGYVDRDHITDFWNRQDIMVSCSEIEGHSISQSEAMAEGAVPVITDTSGARDDVTDGYNGYVVDVGDIDSMADRIYELYQDRKKLEFMGKRAHDMVYNRQKNMDQTVFWDDLLNEVWQ